MEMLLTGARQGAQPSMAPVYLPSVLVKAVVMGHLWAHCSAFLLLCPRHLLLPLPLQNLGLWGCPLLSRAAAVRALPARPPDSFEIHSLCLARMLTSGLNCVFVVYWASALCSTRNASPGLKPQCREGATLKQLEPVVCA